MLVIKQQRFNFEEKPFLRFFLQSHAFIKALPLFLEKYCSLDNKNFIAIIELRINIQQNIFITYMNIQKPLNLIQNRFQKRLNHHFLEAEKKNRMILSKKDQFQDNGSKPKARSNSIKINRARLPPDFFPKSLLFEKKIPSFGNGQKGCNLDLQTPKKKRAQSQRLHISPEKTSFFGFFENDKNKDDIKNISRSIKNMALNRKFQTREQPKRSQYKQEKRRFTPGSNSHRGDALELFPTNYEQPMTQIIISNSSARVGKLSPRKQHISKYKELQQYHNPQKLESPKPITMITDESENQFTPKKMISLRKVESSDHGNENSFQKNYSGQPVDMLNMTFFNAKSSCLPPIKKGSS